MASPTPLYQPLDKDSRTIRLLRIWPTPHPSDGRIQSSLTVRSLNESFKFRALSYTWGEPDSFEFKIWINGILVPVRQNLLCALRVLREMSNNPEDDHAFGDSTSHDERPLIWIDALCINQDDTVEKGHQVDMMGDLYKAAFEVLAWLGTPDTEEVSDIHLDTKTQPPGTIEVPAFQILNHSPNERGGYDPTGSVELTMKTLAATRGRRNILYFEELVKDFKDAFEQLADLCYSAYWNRLWIIQEVCLAQRLSLVYGRRTLDMTAFRTIRLGTLSLGRGHNFNPSDRNSPVSRMKSSPAWKIADLIDGGRRGPAKIGRAVTHIMTGEKCSRFSSIWLERALQLSCASLCHDRKDKLYGVLGLAEDIKIGDILVDYSQSLFALYCKAMLFYQETINLGTYFLNPGRRIIVRFSQVLQKALLGPDFEPSAFADMRHRTLEDWDLENTSTRFSMYGRAQGKVVAVLHKCESVRRSCQFAREIMSDLEKSRFDLILRDIEKILQSEQQVICFITDKQSIGTGPQGIQAGDVVWRDESVKGVQAIIRDENEVYCFVSGIRFLTEFLSPVDTVAELEREHFIMVEVNILQLQEITCPKVAEVS